MHRRRNTAIPAPPAQVAQSVRQWMQQVKEALEIHLGHRGDPLDRAVIYRDFAEELNHAIEQVDGSTLIDWPEPGGTIPGVPPQPENVNFNPSVNNIYITWADPTIFWNHLSVGIRAEIWRTPRYETFNEAKMAKLEEANLVGTTSVFGVYADPVEPASYYRYWLRFVYNQDNTPGPWHSTLGTLVESRRDPEAYLDLLTGQITANQLYQTLRTDIEKIPTLEIDLGQVEKGVTTLTSVTDEHATWINTLYTGTATQTPHQFASLIRQSWRGTQDHAEWVEQVATVTGGQTGQQVGSIIQDARTTSTQAASWISQVQTVTGTSNGVSLANLIQEAKHTTDSHAQWISTVQSSYGNHLSSIQTLQSAVNGIEAQYSVRIDVNGYVSGFGLINQGQGSSLFLINADKFAIAHPSATKEALPFVVANGDVVMDGAYIKDATITDAAIANLTVDKLVGGVSDFVTSNIKTASIDEVHIKRGAINNTHFLNGVIDGAWIKNSTIDASNAILDQSITTPQLGNHATAMVHYSAGSNATQMYVGDLEPNYELILMANWFAPDAGQPRTHDTCIYYRNRSSGTGNWTLLVKTWVYSYTFQSYIARWTVPSGWRAADFYVGLYRHRSGTGFNDQRLDVTGGILTQLVTHVVKK